MCHEGNESKSLGIAGKFFSSCLYVSILMCECVWMNGYIYFKPFLSFINKCCYYM